jgi:hypothetical protein
MNRNIPACVMSALLMLGLTGIASGSSLGGVTKLVMRVHPAKVNRRLVELVADAGQPGLIEAKRGQALGEVARAHCGNVDENYFPLFKKANPGVIAADSTVESTLPADVLLTMPACVQYAAFSMTQLKDTGTWSEIELRDPTRKDQLIAEFRKSMGAAGFKLEDSEELTLYSNLSREKLDELGACKGTATEPAFDPIELLQVLAANNRHMPPLMRGSPVLVVVPDTGLFTDGNMPFPGHRIDRIGWSRNPRDPGEGITPHADMSKGQHGTHVSSIALGGPNLIGLLDSIDVRLRLAPFNILNRNGTIGVAGLSNVIAVADNANAVVNLSVGRQIMFHELVGALDVRSDVLFVVAAGNDGASLLTRRVYPASFGGDNSGRHNLITVAALDTNGQLAAFSNYGDQYVDISAPGCLQSAYEREENGYRIVQVSGTSFAAPHVSFTAALLRAVWPTAVPSRIKARILSGADISPLLDPAKVAYSRQLDVVKSLAVYQDVVEAVVDGKVRRIRGTLHPRHVLFDICEKIPDLWRHYEPGRNTVRKIARVSRPHDALLVDWENYDGEFKTDLCAAQDLSIEITEEDTHRRYEIAGTDLIDVVFAETR